MEINPWEDSMWSKHMEETDQAFAAGERFRNAPDKCQTCGKQNSTREIEPDELHSYMLNYPQDLRVFVFSVAQDPDLIVSLD